MEYYSDLTNSAVIELYKKSDFMFNTLSKGYDTIQTIFDINWVYEMRIQILGLKLKKCTNFGIGLKGCGISDCDMNMNMNMMKTVTTITLHIIQKIDWR